MFKNKIAISKNFLIAICFISLILFAINNVSAFDLNESLLLFIILSVVTIIVGCVLVHYHDFITANKEKGGI